MATDLVDITKTTQEQFLGALGAVQDTIVENYSKVTAATAKYVPADFLPASRELPVLGSPSAYIDLGFGFAAKVLESQRAFAEKLPAAAMPAGPSPSPVVKPTTVK
jgi:hypothetical protein